MSIFGSDPDNPTSGDMPSDSLGGTDATFGLTDQGDSLADSATSSDDISDAAADGPTDEGSVAPEAVRDPAPAVEPDGAATVNDIGGVGSTAATAPEE